MGGELKETKKMEGSRLEEKRWRHCGGKNKETGGADCREALRRKKKRSMREVEERRERRAGGQEGRRSGQVRSCHFVQYQRKGPGRYVYVLQDILVLDTPLPYSAMKRKKGKKRGENCNYGKEEDRNEK